MMTSNDIPQWKKDLILRRRNQSKCQQLLPPAQSSDSLGRAGQQPNNNQTRNSSSVDRTSSDSVVVVSGGKCNACCSTNKMVQERPWSEKQHSYEYKDNSSDSDSSEDLHYGPGIVNKLKNRYLSLALRENNAKTRPSILPMRKATSLENLLDTEEVNNKPEPHLFEKRVNGTTESNRYRNPVRSTEIMKRSRSIETISRDESAFVTDTRPKSLDEETLIQKEGSESWKSHDNNAEKKVFSRLNKPKRIAPVMNEKEKPPVDVVKQTKRIFEGRPEQRTRPPHATGEVAAKVATYKSIIVQTKASKKPLIKAKPSQASLADKIRKPIHTPVRLPTTKAAWVETRKTAETNTLSLSNSAQNNNKSLPSPIPDVSKTGEFDDGKQYGLKNSSLTETPDLIVHSSPAIASPTFRIETTRKFLNEEINNYGKANFNNKQQLAQASDVEEPDGLPNKYISQESLKNIGKSGNSVTFNFSGKQTSHLENNKNGQIPPTQPLKLEINGIGNHHEPSKKYPRILQTADNNEIINQNSLRSESVIKSTNPSKPILTVREIEKNLINSAKTLEQPVIQTTVNSASENVNKVQVPKVKKPPRVQEQNSIVFKFTDRKDIPDYVGNDGRTRTEKVTLPKTGEGGIILLPGASLDESFTEDDDDWLRSLEGPPSPCDVFFINDNVLIDGKSSMSQKSRMRQKMKISFVESVPEIFEYPSETSLLDDTLSPSSNGSPIGHSVPSLGGSSLANYTPKAGMSTEDFQLGVTRSTPILALKSEAEKEDQSALKEVEEPMLFSAGTNSDILF